jgi:formate hydrogenlyase subunit 4
MIAIVVHVAALLGLPILLVGVIQRTKALWAGRKGPPLLQSFFDLARLCRKAPVYSTATTPLFWLGPLVSLAVALVSGMVVPLLGETAPLAFSFDFVMVVYAWGLGRAFLALSALDTGSSFEGMGASRELTYAAFVEPALFLALGTLAAATGATTFTDVLSVGFHSLDRALTSVAVALALFVVLTVESSRGPADDPSTHLELTMIHEVMALDHSGPDLAALQFASSVKMTLLAAVIARLLTPGHGALVHLALMVVVAVAVGCLEASMARVKLKVIPQYIALATLAAFVALLATAWRMGSTG